MAEGSQAVASQCYTVGVTAPTSQTSIPRGRRVVCARCGTDFSCGLSGECWCASMSVRLPLPGDASEDCLCPSCLRKAGQAAVHSTDQQDMDR
jgi:hypothetical protein